MCFPLIKCFIGMLQLIFFWTKTCCMFFSSLQTWYNRGFFFFPLESIAFVIFFPINLFFFMIISIVVFGSISVPFTVWSGLAPHLLVHMWGSQFSANLPGMNFLWAFMFFPLQQQQRLCKLETIWIGCYGNKDAMTTGFLRKPQVAMETASLRSELVTSDEKQVQQFNLLACSRLSKHNSIHTRQKDKVYNNRNLALIKEGFLHSFAVFSFS